MTAPFQILLNLSFISLALSMPLQLFGFWPLFQFLKPYTVDRTPRMRDQPVSRPLLTHRTTQRKDKSTQTFMPRVGFEPTIPVFEQAKTVHVLDRSATWIGFIIHLSSCNSRAYNLDTESVGL
jgi:hypothetical protein